MNLQRAPEKLDLLIVLPAFNEGKIIHSVLEKIKSEGYTNICVVDDGSTDNTVEEIQKSGVILVEHPINRGAGAAVQTGITFAKKAGFKSLILMDSDGQHLPADIELLRVEMQFSQADIIIGNRFSKNKNSIPGHRVFYNQIANVFTNIFCKKNYSDTQSGFRLLNRKAIESVQLKNRGFGFCSEMIIFAEKNNLKIEETPIQVLYTEYSMNKGQNLWEGVRTAQSILWRILFDKKNYH